MNALLIITEHITNHRLNLTNIFFKYWAMAILVS